MKVKAMIISAIALVVLSLGVFGLDKVKADEDGAYPPIVQKLVERFNLNAEEVRQVFDEERSERQEGMQARFEERLNQAMSEGKITEEQKQLILAKHEELQAEREAEQESFKNMTQEERHEAMETRQNELKSWAEQNGIELEYLLGGFGMHGGGPGGMRGGPGFGQ